MRIESIVGMGNIEPRDGVVVCGAASKASVTGLRCTWKKVRCKKTGKVGGGSVLMSFQYQTEDFAFKSPR